MGQAFVCWRYLLVFTAIVLGISGAIICIFSGYFIYQLHEYSPLTPDNVTGSSATLLAMGIITCGFGWFAFQFLNFSNRGQVITFATVLMIITLTEVGIGIWALVRHEEIDTLPIKRITESFASTITDKTSTWDHMQSKLECCGIDGPVDYRSQESIPWSCCDTTKLTNDNSTESVCTTIYKRGCYHIVINRTKSILLHVFLLVLCSTILQINFVVCMCCYIKIYKKKMDRRASEISRITNRARESDPNDNLLAYRLKYLNKTDDS